MTVYLSAHYNLSCFRGVVTKDHADRYQQIIDWFAREPQFKGTISFNTLFLQSIIWENESIVKDISKLCLAEQLELSASMFSNYVPFSLDFENEILEHQIKYASKELKDTYPDKYIKGFYPPFSVFDDRNVGHLVDESYKYIIVDWSILDRTINEKPIGRIDPSFSRVFKLKDKDIYVLPSYNLRSVYRLYPEFYKQYLSSGIIDRVSEAIRNGDEISEKEGIDLFGILTIDLNDLKFPTFRSDFDFDSYFIESKKLLDQPVNYVRPSEIIEKFDIKEIDLKYSLPYEMILSSESIPLIEISPCCEKLIEIVKVNLNRIKRIEKAASSVESDQKSALENLIKNSWNYLLTNLHNTYFSQFNEPIKGVDVLDFRNIWNSINHINLAEFIANSYKTDKVTKKGFDIIDPICGDMVYFNNKFLCSFLHRGGVINNLVNLENGEFIASSPSPSLIVNSVTQEPNFGLMFDIVSKKYSGQYNLFNEGYVASRKDLTDGVEITLSVYATSDIVLKKIFTIINDSNKIDIKYSFQNRGIGKEEFILYSLSKFNMGDYIAPIFSQENLVLENISSSKDFVILELNNEKTNSKVKITLPEEIRYDSKKRFRNLELTLRMKVPILELHETKNFVFNIEIEKK
ncbi:MAG: hypothetical protein KAU62_05715 [Candidatus Heimdallarchaeota archaeon]|nr:hypothetical protein [Candidatus Heimdallarchaeota archaeon]MCG3255562.1 hypothetical protein [Candidatus Heimdallarchaeota archaeon]MCK4610637.1 hypothetical protein [Candidatus Heimdallarchaeota archaeon]